LANVRCSAGHYGRHDYRGFTIRIELCLEIYAKAYICRISALPH